MKIEEFFTLSREKSQPATKTTKTTKAAISGIFISIEESEDGGNIGEHVFFE